MKLNKTVLANAFALSTAILWTVCSLLVWLFPDLTLEITRWWMHGMPLSTWNLNLNNFLLGGISITISFWVVGYVFAWSWEYLNQNS